MLLTITYAFLTYFLQLKEKWRMNRCIGFLKSNIKSCSVIFRKDGVQGVCSLIGGDQQERGEEHVITGKNVAMIKSLPKLSVPMIDWTCYLDSQYHTPRYMTDENYICVLLEAKLPTSTDDYLEWSFSVPMNKRIRVSTLSRPLAWKSGDPLGILMECSVDNYVTMGTAFMEGCLVTDEVLEIKQLISVDIAGKPLGLLRTDSECETIPVFMSPQPSYCSSRENLNEIRGPDLLAHRLSIPMEHLEFDMANSNESLASTSDVGDIIEGLKPPGDGGNYFDSGGQEAIAELSDMDQSILKHVGGADSGELTMDSLNPHSLSYKVLPDSQDTGFHSDVSCRSPEANGPDRANTSNVGHKKEHRSIKPPNVLIYCGKKDSSRIFEDIKSVIKECVNVDTYTVYHLKHDQVNSTPWSDNTQLLIICVENLYDNVEETFLSYFNKGGKIVSFCSSIDKHFVGRERGQAQSVGIVSLAYKSWTDVHVISSRYVYSLDVFSEHENVEILAIDSKSCQPVLLRVKAEEGQGVMLLSQVYLEKSPSQMAISTEIFSLLKQSNEAKFEVLRDIFASIGVDSQTVQALPLTPIHLCGQDKSQVSQFLLAIQPRLQKNKLTSRSGSLTFLEPSDDIPEPILQTDVPVIRSDHVENCRLDMEKYWQHLRTSTLGRIMFYADVMKSTQELFDGFMLNIPRDVGVIAMAWRQTDAKGRGGNAWLNPDGSAVFSLHVQFPLHSELGQRIPCLQHVASLAVVQAVKTIPGYEDLNLRLKWPNDIYYGRNIKIGGVLVNSSIMQDHLHAVIGCGVNVSNRNPTICINEIIEQHNEETGATLPLISVEEFTGRTVTQIELIMNNFQTKGWRWFVQQYYQNWLHSNAKVHLESEGEDVTILGLDEQGFLQVHTTSGQIISVQPDGNSFDMMKNLICMKTR